jgi:hypothetical protein
VTTTVGRKSLRFIRNSPRAIKKFSIFGRSSRPWEGDMRIRNIFEYFLLLRPILRLGLINILFQNVSLSRYARARQADWIRKIWIRPASGLIADGNMICGLSNRPCSQSVSLGNHQCFNINRDDRRFSHLLSLIFPGNIDCLPSDDSE